MINIQPSQLDISWVKGYSSNSPLANFKCNYTLSWLTNMHPCSSMECDDHQCICYPGYHMPLPLSDGLLTYWPTCVYTYFPHVSKSITKYSFIYHLKLLL